jgi:hypothetical protein
MYSNLYPKISEQSVKSTIGAVLQPCGVCVYYKSFDYLSYYNKHIYNVYKKNTFLVMYILYSRFIVYVGYVCNQLRIRL